MNKILNFLKSMTFGVILLGLIVVCSLAGSLITQNADAMTYVKYYPDHYRLILNLQLDHVFTSWYFILLCVLLCLNLVFCSIVRIRRIHKSKPAAYESAFALKKQKETADPEDLLKVRNYLEKIRCTKEERDGITVYRKNEAGWYGSFITHLGLLLTILLFAAAMYMPVIIDQTCMPKESIVLDDGTNIYVDSFRIEDETGRLDYSSVIEITLPDGRSSGLKEISVNHPAGLGRYKVYQQTYGTIGSVTVTRNGTTDHFWLENQDFLSADGKNGIWFDELYPGYVTDEEGHTTLIETTSGHYPDPVYVFTLVQDENAEMMMAFPGDTIEVGDLKFTFDEPTEYPGLRIKKTPPMINALLLGAFLLMTAGLYLSMFVQPVIVSMDDEGYTVLGPKAEGTAIVLRRLCRKKNGD